MRRVAVQFVYASAQIAPPVYATEQSLSRRKSILESVNFRAKPIVQNISVRTGMGSVDAIGGFRDQKKRGSK